ncbi:MAG: hypothetical protein KGI28_06005 [Thaumarchaeota archaeon]|nr:hypothetical protein [Nitrososphaerota archaeon]
MLSFPKFFIYCILAYTLIFTIISVPVSYAQTIDITKSDFMDKVVFDGKWTFGHEWKPTTLTTVDTPTGSLYIRSAHQGDFVYILVDSAFDTRPVKGSDRATVCFDANMNKTMIANSNDYCFVDIVGQNSTSVLQGGSPLAITDYFRKISSPSGFIGIGGISDQYDIYGFTPHPTFEFKIPKDLLGRSDSYGFFVQFYDANSNKFYSWPATDDGTYYSHIPSPSKWGEIISPDHSLPESPFPVFVLVMAFFILIYFNKFIPKYFKK